MRNTAEKTLQAEIMLRLRAYPVVAAPIPNGVWLPARSPAERTMAARIISQMKKMGLLLPGAPDIVVIGAGGAGFLELKRAAEKTLLGRTPKGQLSSDQRDFRDQCQALGVNWAVCTSWDEVSATLKSWGVI